MSNHHRELDREELHTIQTANNRDAANGHLLTTLYTRLNTPGITEAEARALAGAIDELATRVGLTRMAAVVAASPHVAQWRRADAERRLEEAVLADDPNALVRALAVRPLTDAERARHAAMALDASKFAAWRVLIADGPLNMLADNYAYLRASARAKTDRDEVARDACARLGAMLRANTLDAYQLAEMCHALANQASNCGRYVAAGVFHANATHTSNIIGSFERRAAVATPQLDADVPTAAAATPDVDVACNAQSSGDDTSDVIVVVDAADAAAVKEVRVQKLLDLFERSADDRLRTGQARAVFNRAVDERYRVRDTSTMEVLLKIAFSVDALSVDHDKKKNIWHIRRREQL